MNILITGGAGFIGSEIVRFMVNRYPEHNIINYDKLTYAGDLRNLKDIENKKNYRFVKGDVCDFEFLLELTKGVDCIIHIAAESHVDNSIGNSLIFTMSNSYGSHVMFEVARLNKIKKFIYVSTDEVYGSIEYGCFKENAPLNPHNPYSATKAGADLIARSYYITYQLPIITIRSNNVYGPYQYPEKIISRFVTNLIGDKKIPLHGDGSYIRTYFYVKDFSNAFDVVFNKGNFGEIYNIGTSDEISNLELAKLIIKKLGKDESYIEFVKDRPFNDKRYGIDLTKIRALGWKQQYTFEQGLNETIEWYKKNKEWWKNKITDINRK